MADISKIERKGILYNIKDTTARNLLQQKYTVPIGGIPKEDLSLEVQNLLQAAKTAIQNYTETDPTVPAWAKTVNKPTYTAQEVGALPSTTHIPVDPVNADWNASSGLALILNKPALFSGDYNDLINKPVIPSGYDDTVLSGRITALENAGFITQESDPTVPSWAKASTKPSYTASEVGALPADTVIPVIPTNVSSFVNDAGYLTQHLDISGKANISDLATVATSGSYNDLSDTPDIPIAISVNEQSFVMNQFHAFVIPDYYTKTLIDNAGYVTSSDVADAITDLVDSAPSTLDTLNELAAALGDDPNFATTVANQIGLKANVSDVYTKSEIDNAGYLTLHQSLSDYYTKSQVDNLTEKTLTRGDGKLLYNGLTIDTAIANVGISSSNNLLNNGFNMAIRSNSSNPFFGLKEGNNLWYALAASNYFYFGPTSAKALRLDQDGNGVFQTGSVTANLFIKKNGTSSLFLKADGSVDSNVYLTSHLDISGKANTSDLAEVATSGSYNDLTDKPTIPSAYNDTALSNRVTALENAGFLTSETDPNVPAWAKQSTKPTYNASEVGALPSDTHIPVDPVQSNWSETDNTSLAYIQNKPSLFSGSYNDLTDKPSLFSGSYTDLTNKPSLFSGSWNDLTDKPSLFSGSYTDLTDKPTLFSGDYADLTNKPSLFSGNYNDLTNKPTIPTVPTNVSSFINDSGYLTAHQSIKTVNGQTMTGTGDVAIKVYLGTCPTSATVGGSSVTQASRSTKICTVETFPTDSNGKPLVGTVIGVKYAASNTFKTDTSNGIEQADHKINVNNTGDITLYYNNAKLSSSTSANTLVAGYKNRYTYYVYDGTYWVWLTSSYDANTTYSGMTQAEVDAGSSTTGRIISPKMLRDNFYTEDESDANFVTSVSYDSTSKKIQYTKNSVATDVVTLSDVATSGSYNDLSNKPTIPTAATSAPLMDGTADVGSSSKYAKEDHVHPSDTSRVPTSRTINSKALTSDITLTASDVGALPSSTVIPDINAAMPLVVNITESNDVYSADKTFAEILAAWQGGRFVIVTQYGRVFMPYDITSNRAIFVLSYTENPQFVVETFNIRSDNTIFYGYDSTADVAYSGSYNDLDDKPTIPTVPTLVSAFTNDAGYLTSHLDISGKADVVTVVTNNSTGSVSLALDPNKFYKFTGALTALTLTLNAGTGLCIYAGKFTSDSGTACTVTIPNNVKLADNAPSVEAGGTYEFSIADNLMLLVKEGS